MYYAHPSSEEHFYLHTFLAAMKGAKSFQDLCCVNGRDPLPTFYQACLAHGLLEDDNEWRQCLQEAAHMARVATNSETYLSPFFVIALHLIPWHCGWSLESTFVMTFDMLSTQKILSMTLLKSKCLTMVFTSLTTSSVVVTSLSMIGQPCLFLRMIGLGWLETGWLQNRGPMT